MKVKIFRDFEHSDLEEAINNWLDHNSSIIAHHLTQSESGGDISLVTISIFYTQKESK